MTRLLLSVSLVALTLAVALGSIARPAVAQPVDLVTGCQIVSMTDYPVGDNLLNAANDVSGGNPRFWFLTPGSTAFTLFDPASAERSTKLALGPEDEAAFLCVDAPATWDRGASAGEEPPPPPPAPTPTPPAGEPPPAPSTGYTTQRTTDYVDEQTGTFHIVGEVVNNSGSNGANVEIRAQISAGGATIQGFAASCLRTVPSGGDSPFDLFVLDEVPEGATYSIQVTAQSTGASAPAGLTVGSTTEQQEPLEGLTVYHLRGRVTNGSGATQENVYVCAALYDGAGNVVRAGAVSVAPGTLAPGQTGDFEYVDFNVQPASFRTWVDVAPGG